jgi:hypothetical protein
MLKKLKENFECGVEKIRWFSSLLSERVKIELALMRLLYQSEQMEKKRSELLKKIGERVYELRDHDEPHILKDNLVAETLIEVRKISEEIESARNKSSEISKFDV